PISIRLVSAMLSELRRQPPLPQDMRRYRPQGQMPLLLLRLRSPPLLPLPRRQKLRRLAPIQKLWEPAMPAPQRILRVRSGLITRPEPRFRVPPPSGSHPKLNNPYATAAAGVAGGRLFSHLQL